MRALLNCLTALHEKDWNVATYVAPPALLGLCSRPSSHIMPLAGDSGDMQPIT